MAGKKYGLGEKYKALGVGKPTLSINPMQDDLKKLKGMSAVLGVPTKFAAKAAPKLNKFFSTVGAYPATSTLKTSAKDKVKKGVLKTHNAIKDALTSKTGIGATGAAVGYEIGKAKGKRYGGAMKKMDMGGMAKAAYTLAKKNKGIDRVTEADIKMAKKTLSSLEEIKSNAKYAGMGKKMKAMEAGINTKRYGGAMKKMKIGGAAIKGKGAVVGGSGLQDEKLKPGKTLSVKQKKIASKAPPRNKITGADFKAMKKPKKASLGVLMDAGMRNKKVMGAGALGLLSMLAKKK
jgi:hypothetical protein